MLLLYTVFLPRMCLLRQAGCPACHVSRVGCSSIRALCISYAHTVHSASARTSLGELHRSYSQGDRMRGEVGKAPPGHSAEPQKRIRVCADIRVIPYESEVRL